VRQPLDTLRIAVEGAQRLQPFLDLIADEVNVKHVELSDDVAAVARYELQVTPAAIGPRLGKQTQQVIKAVKAGDWRLADGAPVAAGVTLRPGEYELRLVATDGANSAPLPGRAGVVVLDTGVTPELAGEGLARDVIRVVQQARRDAGLDVSDRITLTVAASAAVEEAIDAHRSFVVAETLAGSLTFATTAAPGFAGEVGDGEPVTVTVSRRG
jgi:isoleucyl-tRNA synthetase